MQLFFNTISKNSSSKTLQRYEKYSFRPNYFYQYLIYLAQKTRNGVTEIAFALLRQDNGLQTTDNGGQSRLIAQGSQPFSTFYTLLYLLSPFDFCLLALSLLSDCEASAVATCSLVVSWTCSLLSA